MKTLLFGSTGQVGSALDEEAPSNSILHCLTRTDLDLSDCRSISQIIRQYRPELVLNAAAYTAVDRSESEPALAYAVNAEAPGAMARACRECDALFVHYSTDYVFDGTARQPYTENSPVDPQGVYARSKCDGESAVMAAGGRSLIIRTGWVYSHLGRNFVQAVLHKAASQTRLQIVTDQTGTPTYAPDLARATWQVVHHVLACGSSGLPRVVHASGAGETTWHGFARALFDNLGRDDIVLDPITTADFPTQAPRPAYSVLSNKRLAGEFGVRMPPWKDGLARCVERLRAGE